MDAVSLLLAQHRTTEGLFEKFNQAESSEEKRAAFDAIADDLSVHLTIEEKIFFPAIYLEETHEKLAEVLEEHLSLKRLIVDAMEMPSEGDAFGAKVKVLEEQVEHHVKEEEKDLFPVVKKRFTQEHLEELGRKMQLLYIHELEVGPSRHIDEQTDEAVSIV